MKKELENFIDTVSQNEFAQAHEVLEDKWREYKEIESLREESFILKGLINGATSLALKLLGREAPANQVWDTFLKYEPLINNVDSEFTPLYKEAQNLLHVKYKNLFTCKNI